MKMFSFFAATLAITLAIISPSFAAEPNTIQKTELNGLVTDLNNAAKHKNMAMLANNMPDRLFKEMAIRLRTTEEALRSNLVKQLENQFASLPAGAYSLDAEKIEYRQTDDGTFYALVPTRVETTDTIAEYQTLAIFDNTKWHLIYGGQKTIQNPVFLEIYPAFHNVNIPKETITRK